MAADSIVLPKENPAAAENAIRWLREIMAAHAGVERSETSLKTALSSLRELETEAASIELRNMIEAALLITAGAYARKESRGAHFRLDYPGRRRPRAIPI